MNPNNQAIRPKNVIKPPMLMFLAFVGSINRFVIKMKSPNKNNGLPKKSKSLQNHLIFEVDSACLEFLLKNAHIRLATILDSIPIKKLFITRIVYE